MRNRLGWMMRWTPIAMLALLAASCGPGTQMVDVWQDPTVKVEPAQKVLVMAFTKEESARRFYETGMATTLSQRGIEVVGASEMFGGSLPDSNTVAAKVAAAGIDLAIVSRVVDVNKEQSYVPGSTTYMGGGYPYGGYGFYGYSSASWAVVSDPGYMVTTTTVRIENRAYDVHTGKLVWVGISHTTDPTSATGLMNGLAPAVVGDLVARKILK